MSFKIKSNVNGNVQADGVLFEKGKERTIDYVGPQTIKLVNEGKLVSNPPLTGITADQNLINNLNTITNTTGTAATANNGAVTIPAITDVATAANAIATLVAQVNNANATIKNLQNRVEQLQAKPDHR